MFSFLFLGVSVIFGCMVVKAFRLRLYYYEWILYGAMLGLVLAAYGGLALSYINGFTLSSQIVLLLLLTASSLYLWVTYRRSPLELLPRNQNDTFNWWILGVTLVILVFIGSTTLTQTNGGELWINNNNNYGDIRLHLAYINNFLSGQNIPVENPIFSGTNSSYPFLINFLTAQLVLFGLSIPFAINVTSVIFLVAIAGSMVLFAYRLSGKKSIASIATFLLITSGGLGFFLMLLPEWAASGYSLDFLFNLPHDYSILFDKDYFLGNSVTTYFNPQRAFLLGFPLVLIILAELLKLDTTSKPRNYAFIGLLIGLLPLVHTSSMLVLALVVPYFLAKSVSYFKTSQDYAKHWLWMILPACILGLFLIKVFISQADSLLSYLRLQPVWITNHGSFPLFWWKNAGVALMASIGILVFAHKKQEKWREFVVYAFILFLFANFIITQPWDFDNSKYLVYWYAIVCVALAYAITYFWQKRWFYLSIILLVALSASGMVDLLRRFQPSRNWYSIVSASELNQVNKIQSVIPPKSRVLTLGDKMDAITPFLGRRLVFGDEAWLWSHGIQDYKTRMADIHAIYRADADPRSLIQHYGITYIVISPLERQREPYLNEDFFRTHFEQVYTDSLDTHVYRVL